MQKAVLELFLPAAEWPQSGHSAYKIEEEAYFHVKIKE